MLKGNDLIALGLKPGKDFAKILEHSKTCASREEAIEFAKTFLKETTERKKLLIHPSSALQWLLDSKQLVPPFLEGRQAEPSNSEIRRLLENRAVVINGFSVPPDACMENQLPLWQLVFFPNGSRRVTVIDDPKPAGACHWFDCAGGMLTGTDAEKKEWSDFLASLEQIND